MRDRHYLRAPLKLYNFNSLSVEELPFKNDFGKDDPCPQAIEITFAPPPDQPAVEIALVWDGQLRFLPDSSDLPQTPGEVTESNFPDWNLTGTMILLMTDASGGTRITRDVPLLANWPTVARYEKVTLTRAFLFTTLKRLQNLKFRQGGLVITGGFGSQPSDPQWFEKFVIEFVNGRAAFFCQIDSIDPARDFTEQPMPIVAGAGFDSTFKLLFSCASRDLVTFFPRWFDFRSYDDPDLVTAGATLVPVSLNSGIHLNFNTRHPSHSIIPPRLIFASAPDDAWVPNHSAHPIRTWARTSLASGQAYRRIDLLRTLRNDPPVSLDLMRPYPLHQLAWERDGAATVDSFRIPLDGHIYAPLADADYTFWAIPRPDDAATTLFGDEFRLSDHDPSNKYVTLPEPSFTQTVVSGDSRIELYADLQEHDSLRVWTKLKELGSGRVSSLQDQANARWGIWDSASADTWHHPNDYFIERNDALVDYGHIYGYIQASAGRHGLAPEFLHAVFMGEGGIKLIRSLVNISSPVPFDASQIIQAFGFAGLDLILYRLGMNSSPPPRPDAEYSENLVAEGYVHPNFAAFVVPAGTRTRREGGGTIVLEVADIAGWDTALELVAAELHFRLDKMLDFCAINSISVTTEEQRRFLAYIRYLSSEPTAHAHAQTMNSDMRRWSGTDDPKPPTPTSATDFNAKFRRYETLRRLAVAEWYEASEVYR